MPSHRKLTTILLSCFCLTGLPAISPPAFTSIPVAIAQSANRSLEVRRVVGNVTFRGTFTRANIGDALLQSGQGLSTGARSSAVLALDSGIGFINVAAQTSFVIKELETTSNGGKVTVIEVTRGQVRVQARTFTNPQSILEVITPAGIAGVRGTEFGVAVDEDGFTNVLTNEGLVAVSAQGKTVEVAAGYGSSIVPGEPPTDPVLFTEDIDIELPRARLNSDGVWEVEGKVNPVNFLWVDNEYVTVSEDGTFRVNYEQLPTGLVTIRVQSPLGATKTTFAFIRAEEFPIQLRGEADEFANDVEWERP